MDQTFTKQCPCCGAELTVEDLINDPAARLIGMAFAEDSIECAYYFFQHDKAGCNTSFVVAIDKFIAFIPEAIPFDKLALRECCERHCVSLEDLKACSQPCYFSPFRRFMHQMMAIKRGESPRLVGTRPVPAPQSQA